MPDTIGQRLKRAREERNLSIDKVEQLTRIRAFYINALESDDYSAMPSAVQARGFLRNYASFLEMDIEAILLELQRAQKPAEPELAGPLPALDTASTLPGTQETYEGTQSFWSSILNRFKKKDTEPEIESPISIPLDDSVIETPVEPIVENPVVVQPEPEPVVAQEPTQPELPKKRGRKKKVYITETAPAGLEKKEDAKELLVEIPLPVMVEDEHALPPVEPETTEVEAQSLNQFDAEPEVHSDESRRGLLLRALSVFKIQVNRPGREEVQEVEPEVEVEQSVPETVGGIAPAEPGQTDEQVQVEVPSEAENLEQKPRWFDRIIVLLRVNLDRLKPAEEAKKVEQSVRVESTPKALEPDIPQQSAEEIFSEIGQELRKRRDLLSLTLDEVERHTRLRSVFVKAMEEGDFEKLPSPVQTRGMLANYVTFLDLDLDTILLRFADALQARHRAKYPEKPAGSRPSMEVVTRLPPLRSFIAGDLLFGIGIIIVLFGLAFWGVQRIIVLQTAEQSFPTALSIPQVLAASTLATQSTESASTSGASAPVLLGTVDATIAAGLPTLPANVNVQLNIVAVERTFMRVVVDGAVKFDGQVLPGTAYPFDAQSQIEVLTGNGSALRVTYNSRDQGLMGGFGEVVDRVYTAVGIATPTPTLPPTPTKTPPATPTLTGSETPTFTATPTITGTP